MGKWHTRLARLLSKLDGYGRCVNCRVSWRYRESMPAITYDDGRGAFPLCRACYDDADPPEVTEAFRVLTAERWGEQATLPQLYEFYENVKADKQDRDQP